MFWTLDETKNRLIQRILLVVAYVAGVSYAIYIRVKVLPAYFGNPYLNIVDCDVARYLRLIGLVSHNYPSLPRFDSFANFPWGMKEQLPPIWAFIEASFAILVKRISGVPIFSGVAIFPVIIGLLTALPSYYIGRRLFGKWAGHAAVFVTLFLSYAAIKSFLGQVDHHAADVLLYVSFMALLVGSLHHYATGNRRRAKLLSVLAGLNLTFALFVSLSSILLVVILGATVFLGFLFLSQRERLYGFHTASLTLSVSGVSMLLLYLVTPWFEKMSFSGLSLFQPVLLLGLPVIILFVRTLDRFLVSQNARNRILALLGIYVVLGGVVFVLPGVGQQLTKGFYRSIGYYPLSKVVKEWVPLFDSVSKRTLSILVALLIGFMVWFRHIPLRRELEFWRLLFLVWLAVTTFYFVNATYYAFLTVPPIVISFAVVMGCPPPRSSVAEMSDKKDPRLVIWSAAPIIIIVLLLLWPIRMERMESDVAQTQMLKWIKQATPSVSYYYEPGRTPEYGIVAPWYISEMIETISERPVLATGDHERGIQGIVTSYRIFEAKSEAEAVSIMKKYRLRYILIQPKYVGMPWIGSVERIGEPGSDPDKIARVATRADISKRDFLRLLQARLDRFWGGGSEKYGIEALQHFRLVKTTGTGKKMHKLFELTDGARLVVRAEPGTRATISTTIRADRNRISWTLSRTADNRGRIEVRLPYATHKSKFPVRAGSYGIQVGDTLKYVNVEEDDVTHGNSFFLDFGERSESQQF